MSHFYALKASFSRQWTNIFGPANYLSILVGNVAIVLVLAWIAKNANNPAALSHISVGAFLMVVWNSSLFRLGYTLEDDMQAGTLVFSLISRTPLFLMMLGKALAVVAFNVLVAFGALGIVFLISQQKLEIANYGMLFCSVVIGTIAIFSVTFVFSPYHVLAGGLRGFVASFTPLGVVLGGLLYPVSWLPFGLEYVARLFPMSWAMDSVAGSITGGDATSIAVDWAVALFISALYIALTYMLFKIVEQRIRALGTLVTS